MATYTPTHLKIKKRGSSDDYEFSFADFKAATSSAAGERGYVPTPAAGKQSSYLRGDGTWNVPTNTKNTAGSTNSTDKLFIVGAKTQDANPQTYSRSSAYVGTDGCLYSDSKKVLTDHQDISGKANLASPAFTGVPTAPTASAGTNTTQIATTAYVMNAFQANDAMVFKGTIGTRGTVTSLPATHYKGWTYKVITKGTYAGQVCEIGDMIICVADGTVSSDSDWAVVQSNIDGAVTGPAASTANHVATFSGTTGKVIKDSGYTIGKSVPSNAVFTDTTYDPATQSANGLMSAADKTKLDGIATGATNVTKTSDITNDSDFITSADIADKVVGPASSVANRVAIFNDTTGKVIKDSGYTISKSVPSNAVFTDTTYDPATQSANGLMTASDKTKLDGIATGATKVTKVSDITNDSGFITRNDVATSSVNGTMSYDDKSKLDGIANGATNVTKTSDITNDSGFITRANTATQSVNGTMSSADKTKLDGIATGATNVTKTSDITNDSGFITSAAIAGKVDGAVSSTDGNVVLFDGATGKIIKDSGKTLGVSVPSNAVFTDTTYDPATQSANGLMSAADKTKLDGIATGATNVTKTSDITNDSGFITSAAIAGKVDGAVSSTDGNVVLFDGITGKVIKDSGKTLGVSVPSNAVFTDMTGASDSTAGAHGYVPAPAIGDQDKFLKGDGTWTPINVLIKAYTVVGDNLIFS